MTPDLMIPTTDQKTEAKIIDMLDFKSKEEVLSLFIKEIYDVKIQESS